MKIVDMYPFILLKIYTSLTINNHEQELVIVLENHIAKFTWDYREIKGIHPFVCAYHI